MEIQVKEGIQTASKWATVGGSVIIGVGAISAIAGLVEKKQVASMKVFLPAVTLLVAVSAFSWAMTEPVGFIPVTVKTS